MGLEIINCGLFFVVCGGGLGRSWVYVWVCRFVFFSNVRNGFFF